MEYAVIALAALIASFLTFFSGFGLGTILTPVFALFYELEIAIALTAVVHLLNNLFKLTLVHRNINFPVALRFGIPSLLTAFAGAWLLKRLSQSDTVLTSYQINAHEFQITWTGVTIGTLIIFFSIFELSEKLSQIKVDEKWMIPGALLSGFFGGFSGHQGALRSAFLLRLQLDKAQFIATGVTIACLVDAARLSTYTKLNVLKEGNVDYLLLAAGIVAAFAGALIGNRIFRKTSLGFFKWTVGIFMLTMGVLIGAGIID